MREFVYADPHFGHAEILTYARRPWVSVDKMDGELVKLYNSVVAKDDIVYWLGDVTLKSAERKQWVARILSKMNGTKVLVFGNHDEWHWQRYLEAGFRSCHTALELKNRVVEWYGKDGRTTTEYKDIIMCHDPAWAQDNTKLWIAGHLHNAAFIAPSYIAVVSVELTEYKPVLLRAIQNGFRPGEGVERTGPRENRTPSEWKDGERY